jgi:hypothetical protein
MRPYDGYYDDFDEYTDVGYQGVAAIRRLINERQRREQRRYGYYRMGPNDEWDDEDWEYYDDNEYADYDADEFDRHGVAR